MEPLISKPLTEALIKEIIPGLLKRIRVEISHFVQNKILEYEVSEYRRNYFTKTILHRSIPIPLSDFYVPLHISSAVSKYDRVLTTSVKGLLENQNVTIF